MQTFLPSATSAQETARVLDNKRLNKQALEAWQILMVLTKLDPQGNDREPRGWANHPAVKMWRGYEYGLYLYTMAMVEEWKRRGFKSTIGDKATETMVSAIEKRGINPSATMPPWMTSPLMYDIASTHRQALLVKDYEWYSHYNWPEDTGVPPTEYNYIWPVE